MKTRSFSFVAATLLFLAGCAGVTEKPVDKLVLSPVSFQQIKGWNQSEIAPFFQALKASCVRRSKQNFADEKIADLTVSGDAWRAVCGDLNDYIPISGQNIAADYDWIANHFTAYQGYNNQETNAFFTGYYEISIGASREKTQEYKWPIYATPENIVSFQLQDFAPDLPKRTETGLIAGKKIVPVPTRAEIESGALDGKTKIIAYANDLVDLYFLHVQGSGVLRFPDNSRIHIAYDGKNGHNYTSIGKILIDSGDITREAMTAPVLKDWLYEHPERAFDLMQQNASYVFFRENALKPAVGAENVPLTAGYSLAVDRSFIPYGTPVWVETTLPGEEELFSRLFMAQDTGGAIRGALRADLFWGQGERAEYLAGHLKTPGKMIVLLPNVK